MHTEDPRALGDAIWDCWMEELARLKRVLAAIDDPAERALAGVVLRPRLRGAPPLVTGGPTPLLGRMPERDRAVLAENYRQMLDTTFGDLYPEPPSDGLFERLGGPDPAGWRPDAHALLGWLSARLPPAEELPVVRARGGLLGLGRRVRVAECRGWRLPGGGGACAGVGPAGDYALEDGTRVRLGGARELDVAASREPLDVEDMERLAVAAAMGWVDAV
ncbi:hypothetical protein [Miltoncostaea marina]|uniref:hypothetical protein n=1 Tax=Miltoncostaea marina TaxID=2843215 RepID=UPI001C3D703A|nr:hypothetical protein [Miltoncostaea marina]